MDDASDARLPHESGLRLLGRMDGTCALLYKRPLVSATRDDREDHLPWYLVTMTRLENHNNEMNTPDDVGDPIPSPNRLQRHLVRTKFIILFYIYKFRVFFC